ncbi:tetratricopeptide repeat protein [Bradyrhizobium sp. PMVTL-01]|uniref:tetratricopeptide repeat protein n=1 Tax=Bradyrhizobium sp. PMVTL-01 TaxID=3434999 RepID=UPI003F728097
MRIDPALQIASRARVRRYALPPGTYASTPTSPSSERDARGRFLHGHVGVSPGRPPRDELREMYIDDLFHSWRYGGRAATAAMPGINIASRDSLMRTFVRFRPLRFVFAILVVAGPAAADDDATRCSREAGDVAIAACTRAINSGAGQPSINYNNRGLAYRRKGENDRAIADYTEALRLNPKYAIAYNNRGLAFSEKGENDRAIADYNEALRLDPKYAIAYNNRGLAYWRKGENDRAIADYNEALRLNPKYAVAYSSRGLAYSEKGENDRAIADETEALRLDPKLTVAYNNRGLAYWRKGENDRAIADETEALRLDPKLASAYNNRGLAYSKKGENDLAIADYTEALRLDPKRAVAYFNRGLAYSEKGDSDRAIAEYNEALRLDPKYAVAYVNRGLAYEKLADFARARADFSTALGLSQNATERVLNQARERLAALPSAATASNLATAIISSTAVNNDHRVALVIGNSIYENVAALPNPARDANLVADALKRTGFQTVTLLTNLRKDALVSALRAFAALAETADWAVVYYAGHGMEVGGVNYLIPTDAKIAADRDVGFEAVPLEQVLNAAERAKKLRLVVLDACRDNPFASQMKRTLTVASRSVSQGLAAVEPEPGTLVVYAAKDGETALDGDGINSPFATAFVKNLPTPGLEVRRLFDFVRDDVMEATGRKQKPFSYGSISGRQDFYFVATDAQTRVVERTALSDVRTSVFTYYSLTPDCNQSGAITVRVLKQPSQGTLEIARDRGFTSYPADNIRAKCNTQEVELTRVWYKSNADFKGRDQAQLEAFFTSGSSIKTTLEITVK